MSARQVLELATLGGAALLGRDDIGALAQGKAADLIAVDVNRVEYSGARDLLAAAIFCGPVGVDLSIIDGQVVIEEGQLAGLNIGPVLTRHNELARQMVR
jgi:8-oxoguanine deaminase